MKIPRAILVQMEEEMRSRWLGMVLFAGLLVAPQVCAADEFAGRLERVDWESVTLRDSNDKLVVVRVNKDHRFQAAPFLGRWVTVDFRHDQGEYRAIGFRSCQ
jgi:hypothetical protein